MSDKKNHIRISAILGTVRPGNYTAKALAVVTDELSLQGVSVDIIDPAKLHLGFPGVGGNNQDVETLKQKITNATGVILSTPEYHGGYSSVIKLVIENLGFPSALAGKPVALLGVAGGQIGAIKSLESLAGVCTHVGAIVLPGPVSIANVRKVFDEQGKCLDGETEKRLRALGTNLLNYIKNSICPSVALEAMVRSQAA